MNAVTNICIDYKNNVIDLLCKINWGLQTLVVGVTRIIKCGGYKINICGSYISPSYYGEIFKGRLHV